MSLNTRIRRVVPSLASLTYRPGARKVLRAFDRLPRAIYPDFRELPPNDLRVRVGVGNRLAANEVLHLRQGVAFWYLALERRWFDFDSDIVELGVGCGRRAFHLRDFHLSGIRYRGHYLGIDIDPELLAWCRSNFDDRFEFEQSTHTSATYRNDIARAEDSYRIPRDDESVDFIFGTSLLTHLLEAQARNYVEEARRILKPGRTLALSCFCVDLAHRTRGDRHTFAHRLGPAYIESPANPEAAVAYESGFLVELARSSGFADAEVLHDPDDVQHLLVCTMPG